VGEDRRVRRTRERLHQALIDLILEKGYHQVTVQNLTERADVGRSTFYSHYETKDDLLVGLLDRLVEDIDVDLDTEPNGGFPGGFSALAVFRHVAANAHIFKALIGNGGIDLVERAALDLLTERARSALGPAEGTRIPDDIRAAFLAGSLMALVAWWVENDLSHPPESMASAFNEMTSLR
jgi:AcrR family transcriptional regulator